MALDIFVYSEAKVPFANFAKHLVARQMPTLGHHETREKFLAKVFEARQLAFECAHYC